MSCHVMSSHLRKGLATLETRDQIHKTRHKRIQGWKQDRQDRQGDVVTNQGKGKIKKEEMSPRKEREGNSSE